MLKVAELTTMNGEGDFMEAVKVSIFLAMFLLLLGL